MVVTNIVDVIEAEGVEMTDKGNHYAGVCPLHGDSNPSLVVYKNQPERFLCFGCGEYGDAIDFVRQLRGISFRQAVQHLDLLHSKRLRICFLPTPIEYIVQWEKGGEDVKRKYGKLIQSLLYKELVNGAEGN